MENFVLLYSGSGTMGNTPEEQQQMMEEWMAWFGALGEAVVSQGAPFGPSCTVGSDGSVKDTGGSQFSGYSVIAGENLADAAEKAKGCPVLGGGGTVEIYTALQIG